jgi:hypothetical protein
MNINVWIGLATLVASTFFLAGYIILAIQAYEVSRPGFFISILYLIGAIFFFIYGVLVMYRATKYPVPSWISV